MWTCETSLRWKNNFQADQNNSLFEYNYSTGGNTELREIRLQDNSVDISFDSRRMPTAYDALLGMDSLNNDFLSQTIDSLLLDILPADINFLDSQGEVSVLNDDILTSIFCSTNESNCYNVELSNNLLDFEQHILTSTESSTQCDVFNQDISEKEQLTQQVQTHTGKKFYQYDTCINDTSYYKDTLIAICVHILKRSPTSVIYVR
ncbi:uncharacterized protein TNCV_1344921 [Trichonephila clavipes]|nr:uncharacterized protein TNCV_1344921 [Trichonephila clavipes]